MSVSKRARLGLVIGTAMLLLLSVQTVSMGTSTTTAFTGVANWQLDTVDVNARGGSSIAVDTSGDPRISYEADSVNFQVVRYAKWSGSQWEKETVASALLGSGNTSLALDSNGYPHISYVECNMISCPERYAEWTGDAWVITEDVEGHGSLALDADDNPHISYRHGNVVGMTSLKYTHREDGIWATATVDADPVNYRGASIRLDGNGSPHISYYKEDVLKYAYRHSSEWISQTVDSAYGVAFGLGQVSSLVLDADDEPNIVYYDGDRRDLLYAKKAGTEWVLQTVDSEGNVGMYPSLVLDDHGNPHISYYDADNQAIKYAHRTSIGWLTRMVEEDVGDGDVTSLAIDGDSRLHLSYYDYDGPTEHRLRYAWGDVIVYSRSSYVPYFAVD